MNSLIIIPTYNEKHNIEPLAEKILALNKGFHILFVDDNSPDGTGEVADSLAEKHPEIFVLHRQAKGGLGTAYLEGFRYALIQKYDLIFSMDADFSHHPKFLPDFLPMMEKYDIVLGSKYVGGIRLHNWSFKRLCLSLAANKYVRLITGLKLNDCTCGFKCFKREVLESIDLEKVYSKGYSIQVEMIYRAHKKGFSIGETPIVFYSRYSGVSKMSWKVMLESFLMVFWLRLTVYK